MSIITNLLLLMTNDWTAKNFRFLVKPERTSFFYNGSSSHSYHEVFIYYGNVYISV